MADLYISGDIEADGPIPGPFSMLSFGLAVAARYDGQRFEPRDPSAATFYRELRPISDDFDPDALKASRLDRERLREEGQEPRIAMRAAVAWIETQAADDRPVLVGFPIVFDWLFLHWYFVRFVGESPFGFSGALDMKTMYKQAAGVTVGAAGRGDLPAHLQASGRPHTHHALDDAIEQAEIFNNLSQWAAIRREGPK